MAIRVDAVGDALGRTSAVPSNTAFTICGWARVISDTGGNLQLLVLALDGGSTDGYALVWDFGANDMRIVTLDGGTPSDSAAMSSRPATGVDFFWYIKCGGTGTNGATAGWRASGSTTYQTAQATMAATIAQVTTLYLAGALSTYYADHRVWNVKVWDRELTAAELDVESYFERVMFPTNVHAHWRMRNTSDVFDRSGNGRSLTTGGTLTVEDEYGLWRPSHRIVGITTPSGGGVYNASLAEAGSASDSVSSVLNAVQSIAEAASAADAVASVLAATSSLAEAGAASDAPSSAAMLPSALAESISAADAVSMAVSLLTAVADAASAVDALNAALLAIGQLAEAGSAADNPSSAATLAASVSESGSAADEVSGGAASYNANLSETGSAADTPSAQADLIAAVTETGAAAEVVTSVASLVAALTSAATATDLYSTSGATYAVDVTEAGNLSDLLDAAMTAAAALAESGAASDSFGALAILNGALAEAGSAIDVLQSAGDVSVTIVETVDAQDLLTVLATQLGGATVITVPAGNRTIVVAASRRTITIH